MRSQNKDILLICKGWYTKSESNKSNNLYDALVKYYKKYYSENYKVSRDFLTVLFLNPALQEFLTDENKRLFFDEYLFENYTLGTINRTNLTYHEQLYYRITEFLAGLRVLKDDGTVLIDLSGYEKGELII